MMRLIPANRTCVRKDIYQFPDGFHYLTAPIEEILVLDEPGPSNLIISNECMKEAKSRHIPRPEGISPDDDSLFKENKHGIAGTNVTRRDIRAALVNTFGFSAVIKKKVRFRLVSKDSGFNSKVVLLSAMWRSSKLAKRNGWPENICAKLATLTERQSIGPVDKVKHVAALKNFYDVEMDVYEQLKGTGSFIGYYGCQKFHNGGNKGFLLLDFVDGAHSLNLWESIDDRHLLQVVRDLARVHSLTPNWNREDNRLQSNKDYLLGIFMNRLGEEMSNEILTVAKDFLRDDVAFERLVLLTERLRCHAASLFEKCRELKLPEIFGHADLWSGNVMFQNGEYKTLIDFQMCHFTQIGFDFGRLFAFLASANQRKHILTYFDCYYEELCQLWPGNEITADTFTKSWNLMYPFHYWLAVMFRAKRSWKMQEADDPEEAANRMRVIMKELTEEALEGLDFALKTYF